MRINDILVEFAAGGSGDSGNYFQSLASAWYNGTFDTGSLQKGIKSQQDVEQLLNRGIIGPDGVTRKYGIDYNSTFDGVVISSDDYYEHADHDETDSRTGKPFGPYDYMEFGDEELDESAKYRDAKYKDQLYTQEPPDYNDTREYDNARFDPKPKGYPGRKKLPGGGEYDRTDPLVRGAGIGRSGIKNNINLSGKRKGLPSRDQITSLKQSIKDISGQHTRANLPEQDMAEGVRTESAELAKQYGWAYNQGEYGASMTHPKFGRISLSSPVTSRSGDTAVEREWTHNNASGIGDRSLAQHLQSLKEQDVAEGNMDGKVADIKGQIAELEAEQEENEFGSYAYDTVNGELQYLYAKLDKAEKGMAEGAPISGDGGAVDNFRQQMANNTELAYQKGMAEGNRKPEPPEADYGDDYQDMVKRVKRLAGVGPLKTQYDPAKRVYKNMPTAVQPKK